MLELTNRLQYSIHSPKKPWIHIVRYFCSMWCIKNDIMEKRRDSEISECPKYSHISDIDLEFVIRDIKQSHPDVGERMLIGLLRSRGIIVKRNRVRNGLHKVDPINSSLRWSNRIQRNHTVFLGLCLFCKWGS